MKRILHSATVIVLALVYVLTSVSLTLAAIVPVIMGSGPATVSAFEGRSRDIPRPVFVQRRHVPLIKVVSLSPVIPLPVDYEDPPVAWEILKAVPAPTLTDPFVAGLITGRSPPVA